MRTYESTLREFMRTHPGIRLVLDVALKVVDISAIEVLKKDKTINEKEYNILSNVNRYNGFKTELDKEKISQKKLIDIIERDNEATSLEKNRSRAYEITSISDIKQVLEQMVNDVISNFENKDFKKSGLVVYGINYINLNYSSFNPTKAGSYIKTSGFISNKKATINIQTTDHKCFKYCVLCGYHQIYLKTHPERMNRYQNIETDLNFDGVNYPTGKADIQRFEDNNNISVNVYEEEYFDNKPFIKLHRRTKLQNPRLHIDLLLITHETNKHYVYVKDYNKLISKQNIKKKKGKMFSL